jgi:hypothetical protein
MYYYSSCFAPLASIKILAFSAYTIIHLVLVGLISTKAI